MAKHELAEKPPEFKHLIGLIRSVFGHDEFNPDLVEFYMATTKAQFNMATESASKAAHYAVATGACLNFIKAGVEHGEFLPLLERHFQHNVRTAQNWMRIAQLPEAVLRIPAFSPAAGYALLALPDSEMAELENRLQNDGDVRDKYERMTASELREEARKLKEQCQEERKLHEATRTKGEAQVDYLESELDRIRSAQAIPSLPQAIEKHTIEIEGMVTRGIMEMNLFPAVMTESQRSRIFERFHAVIHRYEEAVAALYDRTGITENPGEVAQAVAEAEAPR